MSKSVDQMSDAEKMRHWIDIVEKGIRGEWPEGNQGQITESDDGSMLTIVVKKKANADPT